MILNKNYERQDDSFILPFCLTKSDFKIKNNYGKCIKKSI